MSLYSLSQVRFIERKIIKTLVISEFELMRRAGKFAFETIINNYPDYKNITILCGMGKNGGDGYIVAGYAAFAAAGLWGTGKASNSGSANWKPSSSVEPVIYRQQASLSATYLSLFGMQMEVRGPIKDPATGSSDKKCQKMATT